jgi:hypothetical protein
MYLQVLILASNLLSLGSLLNKLLKVYWQSTIIKIIERNKHIQKRSIKKLNNIAILSLFIFFSYA